MWDALSRGLGKLWELFLSYYNIYVFYYFGSQYSIMNVSTGSPT